MSRQKRIFIVLSILFFAVMAYVAYDISRRTTFPGSTPQLKERLEKQYSGDSTEESSDSVRAPIH